MFSAVVAGVILIALLICWFSWFVGLSVVIALCLCGQLMHCAFVALFRF